MLIVRPLAGVSKRCTARVPGKNWEKEQSPGLARALSGSGTEVQHQGMVCRLRVGFFGWSLGDQWVHFAKEDENRQCTRGEPAVDGG
jgi:hypothetical protein